MTNGHLMLGYKRAEAFVPMFPLKIDWLHGPERYEVRDRDGAWVASFRNHEDARSFVDERTKTYQTGRAAYEFTCSLRHHMEAPEGKVRCPKCRKCFVGLKAHRRESKKCGATTPT